MYEHILVALDGSEPSRRAGQFAIAIAAATDARVTACHIYGADMHRRRFTDMEPGLPAPYRQQEKLSGLRTAHDRLMDEGFRALSTGYLEDFVTSSRRAGVAVESATMEGRSYVGILRLAGRHRADLIALGAEGLGAVGNGMLGGTTSRVLANAPCDVLIARREPNGGPLLAGVDGSEAALKAAARAVTLGRAMNRPVHITAAYDPAFHTRVFTTMARALSPERREQVGLANQQELHDDIINDGLGKLYAEFLREAEHRFGNNGVAVKTSLATGKAYCALDARARQSGADLIVVGRYGHHREPCSRLGSNAEGLLRSTSSNVLLIGGVATADGGPGFEPEATTSRTAAGGSVKTEGLGDGSGVHTIDHRQAALDAATRPAVNDRLIWDAEAQARLLRVPSFVRSMARRAVENAALESGKDRVTIDDFNDVAARFGMGRRGGDA